jgi:hypothetical protein
MTNGLTLLNWWPRGTPQGLIGSLIKFKKLEE